MEIKFVENTEYQGKEKLTFDDFRREIIEALSDICGEEYLIREECVHKNNIDKKYGISIKERNSNIAPTIYLESFYEDYKAGKKNIMEIENCIIKLYQNSRKSGAMKLDFFKNFEEVRKRLSYKLVNFEKNKKFLGEVPHRRYLDLAIIYVMNLNEVGGSITIRNEHLGYWDVDEDILFDVAQENTPKEYPLRVSRFSDILSEKMKEDFDADVDEIGKALDKNPVAMYVMTNQKCVYGATSLIYKNALREFSDRFTRNLYILPSSIHELILLPENESIDPDRLYDMVRNVNETVLEKEDYLSDNVYYYNRDKNTVEIAVSRR